MTIVTRSRVESTTSTDTPLDSVRFAGGSRRAAQTCSVADTDSSAASWALTRAMSPRSTVRVA
ncbi:hypothetical protein, partial [Escherichia coli]|uniref:hypothetical protein n=1 Tax=Escherichia coli TaxID=562 RepID=UPI001EDC1A12